MAGQILTAETPTGRVFAAVDPNARYCEARVAPSRFSATLTPFRTAEDAQAALAEVREGVAA